VISTCGGGLSYAEPSGAPELDLFLFDVHALVDPTLHLSASWAGPPSLPMLPDGGALPGESVDGGVLTLGMSDFSSASALATLPHGGAFILDRSSNRGDLRVTMSLGNGVAPDSMVIDMRLDPVDAGPDAGPLTLHVEY